MELCPECASKNVHLIVKHIPKNNARLAKAVKLTTEPQQQANLPPELYYNYNPFCSYFPSLDVLPLATKDILRQELENKYSLQKNEDFCKAFNEFRTSDASKELVQVPKSR